MRQRGYENQSTGMCRRLGPGAALERIHERGRKTVAGGRHHVPSVSVLEGTALEADAEQECRGGIDMYRWIEPTLVLLRAKIVRNDAAGTLLDRMEVH